MWQDYFAQHGYLEQTAGWQLALEGLLGEALTPVAFPEKASWKAMTKDGLPLLQHSELQEHMAEAAAASFGRAISKLLASEQLTMPDGLRQSLASMRTFTDTPEEAAAFFALLLQQADARIHAFAEARGLHETGLRLRSAAGHLSWLSCARSSRAARVSSSVTAATRSGRTRALAASTAATRTSRR